MPDKITKFIASLDQKTRSRLQEKIEMILLDPFDVPGIKKLSGTRQELYRVRVGKIRIIYSVKEGEAVIEDIDYRGNVY